MPCRFDGNSKNLIQQYGLFSGLYERLYRLYRTSGITRHSFISDAGMPDKGRNICIALDIPVTGGKDTGFGNADNIKHTAGYIRAGSAGICRGEALLYMREGKMPEKVFNPIEV